MNICALTPGRTLTRSPVKMVNRARHQNLTTVLYYIITFRYVFLFSNASVNFGESESSLVDRDLSLAEGMLVTEKRKWHRCKMKLHDLNIYFGPVTTFKWFQID